MAREHPSRCIIRAGQRFIHMPALLGCVWCPAVCGAWLCVVLVLLVLCIAGVESLRKHLDRVRSRLGQPAPSSSSSSSSSSSGGAAKADSAAQSDVQKDTHGSTSPKDAPWSHNAHQDSHEQAASASASSGAAGKSGLGVADDAPSKDARGSSGDSEDREASCAGEGRCSSDEAADGRRGEAAGAGATSALDDDDLPALDLYADDEGPGKKKRRRKKKRK